MSKKSGLTAYRCQDCGFEFHHQDDSLEECPNCSSTLLDDLATLAGIYLLGDWLDIWGGDDEE